MGTGGQVAFQEKGRRYASDVEENRLAVALDADIETIDGQISTHLLVGNQRPTPVLRDQQENGIIIVGGLIREIQPRIDLPQHAARKDTKHDVRRLWLAVRPRNRTRL